MKKKNNWSREINRLWKKTGRGIWKSADWTLPPDPIAHIANDFKSGLTMQGVANLHGFKIGVGFRLVERMVRTYMLRKEG